MFKLSPALVAFVVLGVHPAAGQIPVASKFSQLFKPGQIVITRSVRDAGTSIVQVLTKEQTKAFTAKKKEIEDNNQAVAEELAELQSKLDPAHPVAAAKLLKQEYDLKMKEQHLPINGPWYTVAHAGEDYVRLHRGAYVKFLPHRSITHVFESDEFWASGNSGRSSSARRGGQMSIPYPHSDILLKAFPDSLTPGRGFFDESGRSLERPRFNAEDSPWVAYIDRRLGEILSAEQDESHSNPQR